MLERETKKRARAGPSGSLGPCASLAVAATAREALAPLDQIPGFGQARRVTKSHGKNAFLFVIVTVALDMMGFGLIIPVLPSLLSELTQLPAEDAVVWGGALTATHAFMSLLSGPTIGGLSDRFGRRPVLLASIGTLALDFLIMGLADTLAWLFLGRALAGLSSATIATAHAYVADVTEPQARGRAFGMLGAAFGIGFVVGPALGGVLGDLHVRAPFFAAAGLAAINFLYGLLVLPESLTAEHRRPFDARRANPLGSFHHFSKLPQVGWFLVAAGIFGFAHAVYPATWSFHGEIRYGWSPSEIGASLALVGVGGTVVRALLVGRAIGRFGAFHTALAGLTAQALALLGFTLADAGWVAYALVPLSSLGGLAAPSVTMMMSNVTPKDAQGELHAASASLQSLSLLFAPVLMTQTLHFFSRADAPLHLPGAAFLLAGVLSLGAGVPLFIGRRSHPEG